MVRNHVLGWKQFAYTCHSSQKSKDISNISNCDAFVAIREDASVYDAIKAMVDKRVHRVAVMNDKVYRDCHLVSLMLVLILSFDRMRYYHW